MQKIAVTLLVVLAAVLLGLRLLQSHDDPVVAGSWRELRPPTFE